ARPGSWPFPSRSGLYIAVRNLAGGVLTQVPENRREMHGDSVFMELAEQPGPGISPTALGRCARDPEHLGGLFQADNREEAELDDLSLLGVQSFQSFQGLIECQEVNRIVLRGLGQVGQVDALQPAAPFLGVVAAGAFYQDTPHRLGRCREEMPSAVPRLRLVHEPNVGFMHERRRLKGLPRLLLRQLLGRQLPQVVVDQRQQLLGGVWVALLDGGQDAGHFGHRGTERAEKAVDNLRTDHGARPGILHLHARLTCRVTGLFPAVEVTNEFTTRLAASPQLLRQPARHGAVGGPTDQRRRTPSHPGVRRMYRAHPGLRRRPRRPPRPWPHRAHLPGDGPLPRLRHPGWLRGPERPRYPPRRPRLQAPRRPLPGGPR